MINKGAIKQYLKRKLDDFSWLKECSGAELDEALAELIPKPDFGLVKLWAHQKAALLLLLELCRFMLFIDMGGGKTLLTLMLLKYRKQRGERPKAIVFVPYITSVETWVEEVAKHAPELTCIPLLSDSRTNRSRLAGDGDLFVACYQTAVALVSEKTKGKWLLSAEGVRETFTGFDTLVMDEVHKCKNIKSLTYRMCRAIASQSDWVLGLTGTPFGRDLTDIWSQFYLIDFGETLGPTLGLYREAFFSKKQNYWGGYEYNFKLRMMPVLKRMIRHRSIAYSIDEFADMPEKKYVVRRIVAPEESRGYCEASMQALHDARSKQQYRLIESNYLQLRQLSSGFLTLKGEDNDRLQIKFEANPKLDVLMELIEALPHGCKMVVFHHFVYTNTLISERLKEAKIKHARIWGGAKNPIAELRKFKDDPDCIVLVINSRSGSSSLNLQLANYVVFFEQPDSPIDRQQAERRCWRPGQEKRVFYYDLLVDGTLDERQHKSNKSGESLLKELLNAKEK